MLYVAAYPASLVHRAAASGPKSHFSMELKQLGYFLGVAESGSFSKAAVRLSVAQPILSRQIKLLESELGVELLYRNGRGVVLSEAGKMLETYARSVAQLVEKAQSEIGALRAEPQGRVAIAMPPSIGWMLTGPLVLRCREAFPEHPPPSRRRFSAAMSRNGFPPAGSTSASSIRRRAADAQHRAFLLGRTHPPRPGRRSGRPRRRQRRRPRGSPTSRVILPARPHGLRVLIDNELEKLGLAPRVEFEVDAMPSTLSLVERGRRLYRAFETAP